MDQDQGTGLLWDTIAISKFKATCLATTRILLTGSWPRPPPSTI
jgi:hypothetical protein